MAPVGLAAFVGYRGLGCGDGVAYSEGSIVEAAESALTVTVSGDESLTFPLADQATARFLSDIGHAQPETLVRLRDTLRTLLEYEPTAR